MKIFRMMMNYKYFKPINQCEQDILNTCEFDNHLNDYKDLKYDSSLCCKSEYEDLKQITNWSHIYYADYETDVTVST